MGNNNSGASTCAGSCSRPIDRRSFVNELKSKEPQLQAATAPKWVLPTSDPEVLDDPIVQFNLSQLQVIETKMASVVDEDPLQNQ